MARTLQPPPYAVRKALREKTLVVGREHATAKRLVEALWQNGEQYHAGAIEYAEWSTYNKAIWREAESLGVDRLVKAELRKNR